MKFVDEITLEAIAGDGGNGVVRWHQNRNNPKGGPAGGNGGRGGDVRIRAVRDTSLLGKYRSSTLFKAIDGEHGGKNSLHGANGEDVVIDLPIGSVVRLQRKEESFELLKEGEEHIILKGGSGGFGNEHFKSSRNVRPMETTDGRVGEKDSLHVELRLIADIGFVGYPNAGKSSLLNALTNAKAKVGDYAFTTIDPNLGELYGYIIADIPGIIEGASEGRGLGHKFLKHINRTKTLIFCISVEQDEPLLAYKALLDELVKHDPELASIPFLIVLTKTDLLEDEKKIDLLRKDLETVDAKLFSVSIYDDTSLKALTDGVITFLRALEN